ncbi:MAG: PEP-utilizing enzyme, partial [Nanoarchaeota archaeon]
KLTDLIQKVITPTDLEDTVGLFVSTMDEPYLSAENELFLDFYKYSQQVDGELTRIINEYKDLKSVQQGEILVTAQTDMNYTPYLQQCAGLITESGGRYSHAAIYARENNLPCITGVENARKLFSEGLALTLDADRNEIYQDLK